MHVDWSLQYRADAKNSPIGRATALNLGCQFELPGEFLKFQFLGLPQTNYNRLFGDWDLSISIFKVSSVILILAKVKNDGFNRKQREKRSYITYLVLPIAKLESYCN